METEIETWRSINLTFRCYCDFLKSGGQRRSKPVWGSVSCSLFPEGINGDRNRDMAQHKPDLLGLLRVAHEWRPVGLDDASDPLCLELPQDSVAEIHVILRWVLDPVQQCVWGHHSSVVLALEPPEGNHYTF